MLVVISVFKACFATFSPNSIRNPDNPVINVLPLLLDTDAYNSSSFIASSWLQNSSIAGNLLLPTLKYSAIFAKSSLVWTSTIKGYLLLEFRYFWTLFFVSSRFICFILRITFVSLWFPTQQQNYLLSFSSDILLPVQLAFRLLLFLLFHTLTHYILH